MARAKEPVDLRAIQRAEKLDISFVAKDPYVTADSIVEILENSLLILRAIDKRKANTQTLRWRVYRMHAESKGSEPQKVELVIVAEPMAKTHSLEVAKTYIRSIDAARRGRKLPDDFPEDSIDQALKVANVLNNGVQDLNVAMLGGPKVEVDLETWRRLDELNKQRFVYSHGTIEGVIVVLSIAGKHSFDVRDAATGEQVHCYFDNPDIEQEAYNAFGHKVSVKGRIKYNRDGKPVSIQVGQPIRLFNDSGPLPKLSDLFGIDITGGEDAVDYIRGLRDNGD